MSVISAYQCSFCKAIYETNAAATACSNTHKAGAISCAEADNLYAPGKKLPIQVKHNDVYTITVEGESVTVTDTYLYSLVSVNGKPV